MTTTIIVGGVVWLLGAVLLTLANHRMNNDPRENEASDDAEKKVEKA